MTQWSRALRPETHDVRRHLEVETFCLQTRRTCVLSVSGHDLGRYAIPFAVMPTARTGCHKMSQRFSDLSSILFIVGQHRRIMLGLTQEEVEEMMICLIIRRRRRRRRNKRQIWIHPLQSDRLTSDFYERKCSCLWLQQLLWRPLPKNNFSVTSRMLWPLGTTNWGGLSLKIVYL